MDNIEGYILFVFEGKKTEQEIFNNLCQHYSKIELNETIVSVYETDIYHLYRTLEDDEDIDLFTLLRSKEKNQENLSGIEEEQVSEIYLFFDYDGHAPKANDTQITAMLQQFGDETTNGKLYLSYPMVEAIRHLPIEINFQDTTVPCKEGNCEKSSYQEATGYENYKTLSKNTCISRFRIAFYKYNKQHWRVILDQHCKKLNHLMADRFELPEIQEPFTQTEIFDQQREKHIIPNEQVTVLSAFPIFLADYYGYSKLPELIGDI